MKTVLIVEDDENDLFLMKMACQRTGIPHSLQTVGDGELAVNYLSGRGDFGNRAVHALPDLIFLDIKLPKRDGHEVLEWIRAQPRFKNLPIVMVTHSTHPDDMDRAYKLGVTSYLRKVASPAEFGQAVRVILKYWLEINLSPDYKNQRPATGNHETSAQTPDPVQPGNGANQPPAEGAAGNIPQSKSPRPLV